ncbi:hypothetical protein SAMN05443287_102508 [Micromonospora phaseoli]|uniref:Uncharacterized protein n=1 Tax=Micromonospora phaseoli TaxID=1144548 RepID=A0A1H6V2G2_9ACTN|nr:hypothetical protein [Micromonospora phaseoli]PZV93739.1 hypothetical protein CLV64_109198 [Micromonospora phaseoli]GIJ79220.1 hypothetical protein Xph01_36520 [Micromonospora phaseoli]SEI98759.1 hypothetical protein SAMN05443287_102508 [Micromonospora phaseoli]
MTVESADPSTTVNGSEFVIRLARKVTGRLAPEESGVFDEVAAAWRAGATQGRAPGGGVGFGIEEALVSAIVIEVVAASVLDVLRLAADTARSRWRRWRARRRPPERELAAATLPAVDGRIVLTAAQVALLREVSRRHATTLGLDEPAADLLADALVGAVHLPENSSDDGHS